jgi:hypothetical protein
MIKKKNKNEYIMSGDVWVRNACKLKVPCVDINNMTTEEDRHVFLENELRNRIARKHFLSIEEPLKIFRNVVIVSDGYAFNEKQFLLADLPFREVAVFVVNGALAKWEMVGKHAAKKRIIDLYVINIPYGCNHYLPSSHAYFPNCVASTRTNNYFIENYRGEISFYLPTPDSVYASQMKEVRPIIDDYRNPVCAAMWLARYFGAKKILLFCCDDSFAEKRPSAISLHNGLWTYEQHLRSQKIIDANAYWLLNGNTVIVDHSSGTKYKHIEYINSKMIGDFFREEDG